MILVFFTFYQHHRVPLSHQNNILGREIESELLFQSRRAGNDGWYKPGGVDSHSGSYTGPLFDESQGLGIQPRCVLEQHANPRYCASLGGLRKDKATCKKGRNNYGIFRYVLIHGLRRLCFGFGDFANYFMSVLFQNAIDVC